MKKSYGLTLCLLALLATGCARHDEHITIFTIGDSTMANKPLENDNLERGWGQVLGSFFDTCHVTVSNHALNGRSSKSFFDEGHWQPVYDNIQPGDYVFIQFGHNDEKPKADRHTDPGSTYDAQLKFYIDQTREKGGIPVLLTSIVRRKFGEDGLLTPTHGDYPQAVRNVAEETGVILIDHNVLSKSLVEQMGPEDSKQLFMWVEKGTNKAAPDGKQDDTHLKELGALKIAGLAVDEIAVKIPRLAQYILP